MIILPDLRAIICGSTARHALAVPTRLVIMASAQPAAGESANGPTGPRIPAQQMRTSIPPRRAVMCATAAVTCSKSRTSARSRRETPPACSISKCARSSSALLRARSPTRAPSAAKPSAKRLPMPLPAPVIRTPLSLMPGNSPPLTSISHAGDGCNGDHEAGRGSSGARLPRLPSWRYCWMGAVGFWALASGAPVQARRMRRPFPAPPRLGCAIIPARP